MKFLQNIILVVAMLGQRVIYSPKNFSLLFRQLQLFNCTSKCQKYLHRVLIHVRYWLGVNSWSLLFRSVLCLTGLTKYPCFLSYMWDLVVLNSEVWSFKRVKHVGKCYGARQILSSNMHESLYNYCLMFILILIWVKVAKYVSKV